MLPVLNPPDLPVTVWTTLSLFMTVTLAPGATFKSEGEKLKFEMVMVLPEEAPPEEAFDPEVEDPLVVAVELPLDEQAAKARAVPTIATAARRRRVRLGRRSVVAGESIIEVYSERRRGWMTIW